MVCRHEGTLNPKDRREGELKNHEYTDVTTSVLLTSRDTFFFRVFFLPGVSLARTARYFVRCMERKDRFVCFTRCALSKTLLCSIFIPQGN